MDKNAIKKYAIWARRELITRVSQRAALYGITEKKCEDASADSINGKVLTAIEKRERQALISQINAKGYAQVMEEVAYTWFNRFSALRFMEVNGYLPSHVRVFTDDENAFKPQILAEAINVEFEGIDMDKIYAMKERNDNDGLFKYLIIAQCNDLSSILPGMFQKIADYTELLFPDNLLREGSVIEQMIALIPEADWQDQVQIIGWLYQYYNAEKKDDVFAALKKNVKITKENIPAATQLFTPDWIVRYMVENSLGRLWLEGHPDDNLKSDWKYYLDEAEQDSQVQDKLASIRKEYAMLTPEQIKCIDPCSGSGHILAYMFDVLMQIYEAYGYTAREAVASIVENNIYGLDIDDRAAQLAYFSVMMKARQYDRRFFSRGILPRVYAIQESNDLDKFAVEYFCKDDNKLKKAMKTLIDEMHDAKEYGSILNISQVDFNALYTRVEEIQNEISIYRDSVMKQLIPFIQCAEILARKYNISVTNPPYMGSRKSMNPKLKKYVEKNYPDSKSDLYTVFIEKCLEMTKTNGYTSLVTQQSFMFTDDYKELRVKLIEKNHFTNMVHLGADAFPEINGEVVQTTAFVMSASSIMKEYKALFSRLVDYSCEEKPKNIKNTNDIFYCSSNIFENVKAMPYSYWLSEKMRKTFDIGIPFEDYGNPRQGMATGENDKFLRYWYEVEFEKIGTGYSSVQEFHDSKKLYIPYNKGGRQIRWYGNNEYVLKFDKTNYEILSKQGNHLPSRQYYCKRCMTWSDISSRSFAARYCDVGTVFDVKGSCGFPKEENLWFSLALLNSKLTPKYIDSLNPTTTTQVGDLKRIPVVIAQNDIKEKIDKLAQGCVEIAKQFYDFSETSWDFNRYALIPDLTSGVKETVRIEDVYLNWKKSCDDLFIQLKNKEEYLNQIFIDLYDLNEEVKANIASKDVTISIADPQTAVKDLISYAVGCMFGRYSLSYKGLAYAGGEWHTERYKEFCPDADNIIPICDDEYFEDDIVVRFIDFVKLVFGEQTLEDNLNYISNTLGGKGQSREVIRNYFINDFYKDHLKKYQKKPIYWLFDSGKKNGFKCLIYMHRYQNDTIARIRTDYVHEQQSRYRTALADINNRIAVSSGNEKIQLTRKQKILNEQIEEIHVFEEKVHHLADQMLGINFDDGVIPNYSKFSAILSKIK